MAIGILIEISFDEAVIFEVMYDGPPEPPLLLRGRHQMTICASMVAICLSFMA